MIPKYRDRFNAEFSDKKYREILDFLAGSSGQEPLFRVAESPIFLTDDFRNKLLDVSESLIDQVMDLSAEELREAVPKHLDVPNDTVRPHFFTNDFGICLDEEGVVVPQLIELQAFPTLNMYQKELENAYCKVFPFLNTLKPEISDKQYFKEFKELIVGDENPENVILLEIYPEKQKTNIDFYLTRKYLGIEPVCLTKVIKEGKKLYYLKDGVKTRIKRIYNRVIFDELERLEALETDFKLQDDVEVEWVTHPNWFFKVSKYILPKLKHNYVPKSYFLEDFPEDENLGDFVLKPLFSFAGSGVELNPTQEGIQKIEDKSNYILQRKVKYAPLFKDPEGGLSKAEVRLLYIWKEGEERPQLMNYLVRLTKAAMVNVDYNKKDAIWIGGSTAFFEK